jgi:hypothetical protein
VTKAELSVHRLAVAPGTGDAGVVDEAPAPSFRDGGERSTAPGPGYR